MSSRSNHRPAPCYRLVLGLLAGAALGCDFPIASSKYSVEPRSDAQTPGDWAEGVDPNVLTLVEAFARDQGACASAFANACAAALAECGASSACVDYGRCVRERADPTADTTCSDDYATTVEDSWRFELVRHCWATRYAECDLGRNFDCVGAYGPPSGERKEVAVRQQVLVRGAESSSSDFAVSFCPEWSDCSSPVVQVETDRTTGLYDVVLPVGGKNFGVGNDWRGYRLIRGREIPDSVVASNTPFWGRRVEITRLLSLEQADGLSAWYGIDARQSVFVQIVDCRSDPAPGVSFELPLSAKSTVGYVNELGAKVPGPTVASGAAGVSDYDPSKPQTILAVREGETIASWNGEVSAGMPRYLRLYPRGRN
jgi:hypothetical protein